MKRYSLIPREYFPLCCIHYSVSRNSVVVVVGNHEKIVFWTFHSSRTKDVNNPLSLQEGNIVRDAGEIHPQFPPSCECITVAISCISHLFTEAMGLFSNPDSVMTLWDLEALWWRAPCNGLTFFPKGFQMIYFTAFQLGFILRRPKVSCLVACLYGFSQHLPKDGRPGDCDTSLPRSRGPSWNLLNSASPSLHSASCTMPRLETRQEEFW